MLYDRDFHKSIENDEYPQAVRVGEYFSGIHAITPFSRFLDFGCSTGMYLREIKLKLPHVESKGFEFAEDAVNIAVCEDVVQCDLTQPVTLEKTTEGKTFGLCLEVLEHISDDSWEPVLRNITRLCDKVMFSAAVPGQGGTGHINCRDKIDWIRRFHSLGWVVDLDHTKHFLEFIVQGYHMRWLKNNVIVFVPGVL